MNRIQPLPSPELALQRKTCMEQNKVRLLDALRAAGAVQATVSYSGSEGGSGTDGVKAHGADQTLFELRGSVFQSFEHPHHTHGRGQAAIVDEEWPLEEALMEFAMQAVDHHHDGWANNAGGEGEVIFDCVRGSVRLEHKSYRIESSRTETML